MDRSITHTLPEDSIMYQALVQRNSAFEGIFFAAIKTTGIFCRPTCTAKKPKPENVVYFSTQQEALLHGYRPCKICKPEQPLGKAPEWVAPLLDRLRNVPEAKISDGAIREMGLDPSRVRRWFKKHYGMTFQAFQRNLRINHSLQALQEGVPVTHVAFDTGFEALSNFGEQVKKVTGASPRNSTNKTLVQTTRILTPLGPMLAGASSQGICLLEFADRPMLETQLKRIRTYLNAVILPGESPLLVQLRQELDAYFQGERDPFAVPLVMPGSKFQQLVWAELQQIPYGQTRSYTEQAAALGKSKAVRAVARANGDNRIAIVVPCHRIIGSDGELRGYGGGLWRKRFLLDLEKSHAHKGT